MVDGSISKNLRRLAIATGCFVGSTGLLLLWTDPIGPGFLALGAAIQPRSDLPGKWLMWAGALSMNFWMCQFAVALPAIIRSGYFSLSAIVILLGVALVLWCDVALVTEVVHGRRRQSGRSRPSQRELDWVAWIAAVAWTVYFIWWSVLAVHAYKPNGRLDNLLPPLGLGTAIAFLDVALVFRAITTGGEQTSPAEGA